MDKASAQRAVDEAFTTGMYRVFDVLQIGLGTGAESTAVSRFRTGLENLKRAHDIATAEVEKSFAA